MVTKPNSTLGLALLGLIRQEPRCGYDLRKLFVSSPLAHFSDSPGSIYPALGRLRRKQWIRPLDAAGSHPRRKRRFTITSQGLAALKKWLRKPVERADVMLREDELMLRFVFLFEVCGRVAARRFLKSFEREFAACAAEIREYLAQNKARMQPAAWLAVQCGLEGYEAQAEWARRARSELRRKQR
jgi:DNA-binding PadR family transcriptional regulator